MGFFALVRKRQGLLLVAEGAEIFNLDIIRDIDLTLNWRRLYQ